MGNRVSVSDYANIYSHTPASWTSGRHQRRHRARRRRGITYHATVLAGVHVQSRGMVGAVAVATKDVEAYT